MDDEIAEIEAPAEETFDPAGVTDDETMTVSPQDKALVKKINAAIKADKDFHDKAFKRMRRDMHIVKTGRLPDQTDAFYTANIIGRHIKQKTAALYAKNPKAVARRRETIDYAVWDENVESLKMAFQVIQTAQQMQAASPPVQDPMTGEVHPSAPLPPGFEQAQALMADFQQGTQRRQEVQKIAKTLEVLFAQAMREQKPIDFKTGMKKLVRRALTTGVAYIELGFQRETGPRPGMTEKLADARQRIDHLTRLAQEADEGEFIETDAEMAELDRSIAELQAEPEIVLREGLIVDFPASTRVIPDKLTKSLVGFVGSRHLTLEYLFTVDEVKEMFGVDIGKNFKGYTGDGKLNDGPDQPDMFVDLDGENDDGGYSNMGAKKGQGLVCVWKHYDKPSGMMYFTADGYENFLRQPAAPDVFVEDFWPVYALTFNDIEHESELYPPSEATLLLDMQLEYNRSRQGKREHRQAARPRWATPRGAMEPSDIELLKSAQPFEVIALNKDPQAKLSDILEVIPVPGVDPNLYDTGEIFGDIQLVGGASEASYGGTAKATATESAIAANSSSSTDGSAIDDLDAFLSVVARAGGQILLKEMSEEQVKRVAGVGSSWPHMTLADIADELFLEVEAGSTGKPNQAIEIANIEKLGPLLLQMPAINPVWLAKQMLKRLDDRLDLTDAIIDGIPAIVAQNRMQQPAPGDPQADPTAQGPEGADKTSAPGGPGGSGPAFGSNQV